jgi:hypothetical protein
MKCRMKFKLIPQNYILMLSIEYDIYFCGE